MNNTTWKVYKIVSPTGRVYIGCTEMNLDRRFQKGRGYKNNPEMFDDIIQFGWANFDKSVIAEFDDEQTARDREHEEIKNYPDGYNRYRGITGYIPTGNPPTEAKQVMCIDTGVVYESIKEAARQTGCSKQKISYCCRGIRYKKTGGLRWKFVN